MPKRSSQFCLRGHDTSITGRYPGNSGCKACEPIQRKIWETANPDRNKIWQKNNPEKYLKSQQSSLLKRRCKQVGITVEYYSSLPKKCSFKHCTSVEPGGNGDWHLDHSHLTKKFRGLLCHNHNNGLGRFHDSIEELQDAIVYLKEHSYE